MSHEGIPIAPTSKSPEVSDGISPAIEQSKTSVGAIQEQGRERGIPATELAALDALALAAARERLGLTTQEPTAEALEKVKQATEEADPTTYSQLSPADSFEQVGVANGGNKIVAAEGVRYININQYPERQEAVVRMLKGIMNVSDIVKVNNGENPPIYYSKEMPIDRVQQETSLEETQADHFILKQVFGDFDHKFSAEKINNTERRDGRSIHYDFGNANPMNMDDAMYSFKLLEKDIATLSTEETGVVLQKLDALQKRFAGADSERFISSIIKASGMEPIKLFGLYDFEVADILEKTGAKTVDSGAVQKRILNRIDTVRKSISEFVPPPSSSEKTIDDELPPPLPEDEELPPPLP